MHPFLTLPSANPGAFRATQEGGYGKTGCVGKSYPAVEESYPAVEEISHGFYFFFLPNSSVRAHAARRWASGEGAADGWRDKL